MYNNNKRISMHLVKAHTALTNLYTLCTLKLKINDEKLDNDTKKEQLKLQTKLGYQLIALSNLQYNSPNTINEYVASLQEWKEIKDRLQPHHNPYTSDEQYLEAQFEAIDYFYDNYVTE